MRIINEHKTAILVFARSSQEELKCKKINNAAVLFTALSNHTLKTVQETGLPYFHLTEKDQKGNSFGERFANAIEFVYDRGFEQVITIGNDSPHLKASQILKSANILSPKKVVLGPSIDGGFYLMGLHKSDFSIESFRKLPWQTSQLWGQLKTELDSGDIELIQLSKFHDIDNENDLKIILKFPLGLSNHLFRAIQSIIISGTLIFTVDSLLISFFQLDSHQTRGSPTLQNFQSLGIHF